MSYNKMPPQAYTKETLQEAFEWWNQQPEDFRDKVQDNDDLVGYYLKVQRGYPESEVNEMAKASFSSELKGIAKNLDDFEGYQSDRVLERKRVVPPIKPTIQTQGQSQQEPSVQLKFPNMTKDPVVTERMNLDEVKKKSLTVTPAIEEQGSIDNSSKYFKLDARSLKSVKEVRYALNLSSDQEALRAIVALGATKLTSLP